MSARALLPTRELGKTGMQITAVGFGAWAIGGGDWSFGWGPQDDADDYLFTNRLTHSPHISTRHARIVKSWVARIGLDPNDYGTHTLRRTKATLIYKRTKNLRAVQLLLGHTKLESTVRYLGIEVDDALEMSEQTEV